MVFPTQVLNVIINILDYQKKTAKETSEYLNLTLQFCSGGLTNIFRSHFFGFGSLSPMPLCSNVHVIYLSEQPLVK